jgi:hypothetical protein
MKRRLVSVLRLVGLVAVLAAGMATSLALADPAHKHKHKHSDSAINERSTETDNDKTETGNTDTDTTNTDTTLTETTPTDTTPTDTTPTETTPTETTPTETLPTTATGLSAQALPPTTLDGEILFANDPDHFDVSPCTDNGDGTLSFTFDLSGVVTSGFYFPGTFSESGEVTFTDAAVINGAHTGPVTSWDVSFSIQSPNGSVTGTKHLSQAGALCTSPDTPQNVNRNAGSNLTYSATIHTPGCTFTDHGDVLTFVDYQKFNGEFVANSPSLTENFTSTEPNPVCAKNGGKNHGASHHHHHRHHHGVVGGHQDNDDSSDDQGPPPPAPSCLTTVAGPTWRGDGDGSRLASLKPRFQGTLDARHLGPVTLGEPAASIELRLGEPTLMSAGFARYCLLGGGNLSFGLITHAPGAAISTDAGRATMALTDSSFYRVEGVGVGSTLRSLRARFPLARQRLTIGPVGVWWLGKSTIAGVQDGRVVYLGIYDRRALPTLGAVSSYLTAAGIGS